MRNAFVNSPFQTVLTYKPQSKINDKEVEIEPVTLSKLEQELTTLSQSHLIFLQPNETYRSILQSQIQNFASKPEKIAQRKKSFFVFKYFFESQKQKQLLSLAIFFYFCPSCKKCLRVVMIP